VRCALTCLLRPQLIVFPLRLPKALGITPSLYICSCSLHIDFRNGTVQGLPHRTCCRPSQLWAFGESSARFRRLASLHGRRFLQAFELLPWSSSREPRPCFTRSEHRIHVKAFCTMPLALDLISTFLRAAGIFCRWPQPHAPAQVLRGIPRKSNLLTGQLVRALGLSRRL